VYRVTVPAPARASGKLIRTFRTRAEAQAWERSMLAAEERSGPQR
jgi:hypothetical protein